MKFGYLTNDELDKADLSLPPDDTGNVRILPHCKSPAPLIYVGCAEYRVKEWNGLLYPQKTKEEDMLQLYSEQFRILEMNGTHYRIYPTSQIAKWVAKVGDKPFLFLPKFPKDISHEPHSFTELQAITAQFIESVQAFGPHLGPLFLQMSEYFTPATRSGLFAYLASLPEGFTYFVELRHPSWFTDMHARADLFNALRALGIGAVITDTPGHREVCHMALTIPKVMIRFVGRHAHPSTSLRANAWIGRLASWIDMGLEECYFISHTGLNAPITASHIIIMMNEQLGAAITPPHLLSIAPSILDANKPIDSAIS